MSEDTSAPIHFPFNLSAQEVADLLHSDVKRGLHSDEIPGRLTRYGHNEVSRDKPRKRLRIFMDQFLDPVILILVVAAALAYLFKDAWEGTAILVVILISVGIGFVMESQAYRTLEALCKLGQSRIRIIRSGTLLSARISEIVPGDLVVLNPGDMVPADLRLVTAEQLSLKESALTGESTPSWKQLKSLPRTTPVTERSNMLFKGTMVLTGSGTGLVVATGFFTELGKIQQLGIEARTPRTPLEKKLKALTIRLIWVTLGLSFLIAFIGFVRGADMVQMIETAVALAVAAIPEGLPIVATIALARGMSRLSKRQVIVKNLEAIQTLGATDVVMTDKTGTLTEDRLKVHSISIGTGFHAATSLSDNNGSPLNQISKDPGMEWLMRTAVLCNNVGISDLVMGDSLESALVEFATSQGYDVETIRKAYPELWELPFDAERKLMVTVHENAEGYYIHVKGAFETLVTHCNRIQETEGIQPFENKHALEERVSKMAATGLRTLAFAYAHRQKAPKPDDVLKELVFTGVIGFLDPPRKDVRPVFEIYRKAGIRVIMITGDHPETARRIAREVGLIKTDTPSDAVLSGVMTPKNQSLDQTRVFARVLPREKLDLVSLFQEEGHVVGMIGDGINDVPALKKSDIGIAMGIRGTEAAREASDVILKNDSFTAIEMAIRQGRVVFENIKQFTVYLLSCNLAEILAVAVAALWNLPAPLLPMQILFLNLVTDVFPALALGLGKGPEAIMEQPPRDPKSPILNEEDWLNILIYGLGLSAAVLGTVLYGNLVLELRATQINNLAFYSLVAAQLFHVFNLTESKTSFFKNEIVSNPFIWGALLVSFGITAMAYFYTPLAAVLDLERIKPELLLMPLVFALGSVLLLQSLKALIYWIRHRS